MAVHTTGLRTEGSESLLLVCPIILSSLKAGNVPTESAKHTIMEDHLAAFVYAIWISTLLPQRENCI